VLTDWLLRDREAGEVRVSSETAPGARRAELRYRTLARHRGRTWVEIEPATGRMHQIRVQLASRGWPIVGDRKYGARSELLPGDPGQRSPTAIALHARALTFKHPIRYDELTIVAPIPASWRGLGFDDLVTRRKGDFLK
jgi:23S rRNA pseudouridine1911/1915/1917 synthase